MKVFVFWALCALSFSASAAADDPKQFKPISTDGGRYALGQINDFRSDQFLLDTKTGKAWQVITITNDKNESIGRAFRSVPFIDKDGFYVSEPPTYSK